MSDIFRDIIHQYTRNDAINDGILVDASETALEAGIVFPVALTSAVWNEYVKMPVSIEKQGFQSESGRLWDIIWMLRVNIPRCKTDALNYQLSVNNDSDKDPEEISLKAQVHPGDDHEPVITIMLPHED